MCHVLIIEDQWIVAAHIAGLAEDGGAPSVVITGTEREAVEAARERQPAIILSDVSLLEGTGPLAVAAIIAEHGPIPVIFITASPEGCHPCNAAAVILNKPVDGVAVLIAFKRLAVL
jgi:CheY-like chemotaxis protein